MMCRFCDPNTFSEESVMENNKAWVDITIQNNGGEVTMVAWGDNEAIYHPKYCPECGRRLKFEDN